MTAELASVPVAGPAQPVDVDADVAELADKFVELMRTFGRARNRMLAAAVHDVEWSAHAVLKVVQIEGQMRAGAVAEFLQSDPSTVSRQVAAAVKAGLLERRADPDDGRASLLALTPRGAEVLAEHDAIRLRYFAELMAGWDGDDVRRFSSLLSRFTDDFESKNHEWASERTADLAARTEGKHI